MDKINNIESLETKKDHYKIMQNNDLRHVQTNKILNNKDVSRETSLFVMLT
jgi:hypothetical protein